MELEKGMVIESSDKTERFVVDRVSDVTNNVVLRPMEKGSVGTPFFYPIPLLKRLIKNNKLYIKNTGGV